MNHNFQLDLTLMPKELKVLLELIKDNNDEHICQHKNEWFTSMDWDYFLKLAMHHRIYPLVYLKLKEVASEITPSHVLQALQVEYQKNTFQMLHLSGEMERIGKLFDENQISSLFLKGPAVAYELYGDISLRTSKDLDILIPETQLEKAEKLLLKDGYKKKHIPTVLNEIKWRYHHIVYFHLEKKVQIEIHWRLHPRPMKEPKFEKLLERKRVSSLTTYPVSILGKEDLFLYLVAHGARHGWFRLRWLKDIDQMSQIKMNYTKINFLVKKYHYQQLVGQGVALTNELLDTSSYDYFNIFLSKSSSKRLAEVAICYMQEMGQIDGEPSVDLRNYYKKYLSSLKSRRQKLYLIIISIYPTSADKDVLNLPERFHFLYFILRPFLWTWRKLKKSDLTKAV